MIYELSDTIVAVSTPRGSGGIGIVRLSGDKSISILFKLSCKKKLKKGINYATFFLKNKVVIDQGLFLFFKSPNSFTGEHVIEIHVHGNDLILDSLVFRCIELGARLASNGEFSFRAYINNKLDLIQVESINSLITSNSLYSNKFIFKSLSGKFSLIIKSILDNLIKLRISIEASIEFPDHVNFDLDLFYISFSELYDNYFNFFSKLAVDSFLSSPMNVVILGEVNVGKSSLFNYLLKSDRSIISNIPGTTRDFIDSDFFIDGFKFKLIDTAGFNSDSCDFLEKLGIERTFSQVKLGNILIFMTDITSTNDFIVSDEFRSICSLASSHIKLIVLRNKIDLVDVSKKIIYHKDYIEIFISVKTSLGLDLLLSELKLVFKQFNESFYIVNKRQFDLLFKINSIFKDLLYIEKYKPIEIYSEKMCIIIDLFHDLLGINFSDKLLCDIFSNFCVGK